MMFSNMIVKVLSIRMGNKLWPSIFYPRETESAYIVFPVNESSGVDPFKFKEK